MKSELRHYWRLTIELGVRFIENPLDPEIDNLIDDLELLRDYTGWPTLRGRCVTALADLNAQRDPLVLAAANRAAAL